MFLKFFAKKKSADQTGKDNVQLVYGIDRAMHYCPDCEDEFRSDIDKCPSCDVLLITGEEKIRLKAAQNESFSSRSMEIEPGDELVSIRKGPLKDIKILQKILASERIPSLIAGDEGSCGKGCCGSEMYLQIKNADSEAATVVLARDFVKTTAVNIDDLKHADVVFDERAAETVCPACGCRFSPTVGACPECGLCFA